MIFSRKALLLCGGLVIFTGCGERPTKTPTEGAFGQISAQPSTNIARATPPSFSLDGSRRSDESVALAVLQTELSPAIVLQTDEREISLFTELERSGRAAPSYAALSTRGGPRPFKNAERFDPAEMEENWMMVWFSDARGWTNGDVPWVVYLQHRPRAMRLDTNGLNFVFDKRAGSIALLPLYGMYLCPTNESKSALKFGGKPVQTWAWSKVLHREPLMRVRYWASALRKFPQDCEETFSVDRATDTFTIRQKISYLTIEDEWGTKPLELNPVSPTLALASSDANFPVKFSRRVMDLEMPTAAGPYMATDGPLEASFRILQHINEGPTNLTTELPAVEERGTWAEWRPAADKRDEMVAIAHNAYRAGRIDDYNYACYLFTRAFTHHYFTTRAAEYARTLSAGEVAPQQKTVAPTQPRLIPSTPPTPFVPGIEREVRQPGEALVAQVSVVGGEWPQLVLRGTDLRFGSIKVGNAVPKKSARLWHSPTTERIVVLR